LGIFHYPGLFNSDFWELYPTKGVVKFDNQVLNGINFRAGELLAHQVKLSKVLTHIIESQYIDDLCKAQLKTFF
jgi:hypothetical protein